MRPSEVERRTGALVTALIAADLRAAGQLVDQLHAEGAEVETLYANLLAPSLRTIGEMWAAGEVSIAEEHIASSLVEQLMALLYPDVFVARRSSRERVLMASAPGERHVIGLRMVADIFEGHGYDVIYLGADTPASECVEALRSYEPEIVVLAAYTAETASELRTEVESLLEVAPEGPILAGGDTAALRDALAEEPRVEVVARIDEALPALERVTSRGFGPMPR